MTDEEFSEMMYKAFMVIKKRTGVKFNLRSGGQWLNCSLDSK